MPASEEQAVQSPAAALNGSLAFAVLALTVGFIGISILFGLFLYKQNNLLIYQIKTQVRVLATQQPIYDSNRRRMDMLANDLKAFAEPHPEVLPILYNYNVVRPQTWHGLTPSGALSPAPSRE